LNRCLLSLAAVAITALPINVTKINIRLIPQRHYHAFHAVWMTPRPKIVHHEKPLRDTLHWIRTHLEPDQVFTDRQLDRWAKEHGYRKEKR